MKWTHAGYPVAKALRAAALKYPETVEDMPWGHPAYKVAGKKAFMFVGGDESTGLTVSMKLRFRAEEALNHKFAAPTGYGLGKSGWVTFTFGPKAKPPLATLVDYLDESWRAVAPKKLSAAFAPPKARVRKKAA
jgi:predicted DNA-binding protein (MmcQ/YjbR family)